MGRKYAATTRGAHVVLILATLARGLCGLYNEKIAFSGSGLSIWLLRS